MSLADTNTPLNILKNPVNVQKLVLDDVHARFGGKHVIVDPNNVAMHLLEMSSVLTAQFAQASERALAANNSLRAQTSAELAKHMSDYDYVGMYSTPSTTKLILMLNKAHLVANGKDYETIYKKIVIPKDAIFTLGDLAFGIYYPIELRINDVTGAVLAVHDTTIKNPLLELNQNIVQVFEHSYLGTDLVVLNIPVYQFIKSTIVEDTIPGRGFAKVYQHIDKFYAVRIFTTVNEKRIELAQSMAVDTYDPFTPTARLQVSPETKQFSVNIPQIYFNNGQIGPTIELELYVTRGAMDLDISGIAPEAIKCLFNTHITNDPYSKVLDTHPDAILAPSDTRIVGGSNGLTFEERRERVVNNAFHATSLVTQMDLDAYFKDTGFRPVRYMDDLTNLIYFVHRALEDKTNTVVPATTGKIELTETTHENVSSIKKFGDGILTILPTTIYKYTSASESCVPLTDTERTMLSGMSKKELVAEFNSQIYTKSPLHMRLIMDGRYPKAGTYNLMDPSVSDLAFSKENSNITAQMVAGAATIHHRDGGSNGYRVEFLVNKSKDLESIPEEQVYVYMYTEASDKMLIGLRLTFAGMLGTSYLYEGFIETDYYISRDHKLRVTSMKDSTTEWDHIVPLTGKYHLVFMVNKAYFPAAYTDPSLYSGIPSQLQNTYMVMLRQTCTIQLGHALDDVIYNDIDLSWTGQVYDRYPIDIPLTYPTDVYLTDENGVVIVDIDPVTGEPKLTKVHSAGDQIYDQLNNPLYLHRAGEVRYDDFGKPVVLADRIRKFYISAMMIDARIYLSEHPTQEAYRKNITTILESYFETIRQAIDKLPERDLMYFRPMRTMGNAKFLVGDGVTVNMPLNMRFRFRCHVQAKVASDASSTQVIRDAAIAIIEPLIKNNTISLTDIAAMIVSRVDYIESIDVLGINDDVQLQTITIDEKDVQPSIAQELYLTESGTLAVRKAVDVEFVIV